jgi:hypothetical protein
LAFQGRAKGVGRFGEAAQLLQQVTAHGQI